MKSEKQKDREKKKKNSTNFVTPCIKQNNEEDIVKVNICYEK